MRICTDCNIPKDLSDYYKYSNGLLRARCKPYTNKHNKTYSTNNKQKVASHQKKYRDENKDKTTLARQIWQRSNRAKVNFFTAKRRALLLQRTPKWLTDDHERQIMMFYDAATSLTKELNVKFEVDHIIPLQGENVSGLHVPWNLQVLTKSDNARKYNR